MMRQMNPDLVNLWNVRFHFKQFHSGVQEVPVVKNVGITFLFTMPTYHTEIHLGNDLLLISTQTLQF